MNKKVAQNFPWKTYKTKMDMRVCILKKMDSKLKNWIKNKNIKLPPVPPPLPLMALFVSILLGIVLPKALAESQGVILYFSTEICV